MTDAALDAQEPTLVQKLGAEAIGTAVLVFIGCGAAVTTDVDIVATGLAFGIAIVMMAYSVGRISGGHFNPAVSLGAVLSGRLSWKDCGLYSAAQVGGGLVGGLLLAITLLASDIGWEFGDMIGANGFGDDASGVGVGGALLIEIILTFIFLMVILGTTDERNGNGAFAGLAIGLALTAIHFVAIPVTGTSVNPARSIGVAFFGGAEPIKDLWLFILAPLAGAAIAGFVYPALFGRGAEPVAGSYGAPKPVQQQAQWAGTVPAGTQQQQWALGQQAGEQQAAAQQQTAQYPATQQQAAATEQPIIQDGWQWDPQAQQWIPAQQAPPPAQPTTPEASPMDPGATEQTQVRRPDGES